MKRRSVARKFLWPQMSSQVFCQRLTAMIARKRISIAMFISFSTATLALVLSGCGQTNDNGLSSTQQSSLNRTQLIVQKSGGDWSKLSPDDQHFLIKGPGYGNEKTAKQFLIQEAERQRVGLPKGGLTQGNPPPSAK